MKSSKKPTRVARFLSSQRRKSKTVQLKKRIAFSAARFLIYRVLRGLVGFPFFSDFFQ